MVEILTNLLMHSLNQAALSQSYRTRNKTMLQLNLAEPLVSFPFSFLNHACLSNVSLNNNDHTIYSSRSHYYVFTCKKMSHLLIISNFLLYKKSLQFERCQFKKLAKKFIVILYQCTVYVKVLVNIMTSL